MKNENSENFSIAIEMIKSKASLDISKFNSLMLQFESNLTIRETTIVELIKIAKNKECKDRAHAIVLLGALREKEAEYALAQVLLNEFPKNIISELSKPTDKTDHHVLLYKLLSALVLINPNEWIAPTLEICGTVNCSWMDKALKELIKNIEN
jgi:hypothetical protein